jgi:hypothetical protein
MPVCALLAAAAAALSSLAFAPAAAPAASADAGDITILSVSSPVPPKGNAGLMTVNTQSGSPITDLTVHLYDAAGDLELTIPSQYFQLTESDPTNNQEFWSMQNPITTTGSDGLAGLAPGTYTAKVDATDAQGPETDLNGGSFPFLIQPTLTLSATPSSISYTQQTVTFSGKATDYQPGTMSQQAFGGQQLQIVGPTTAANPTGSYTVTTDSQGNFQLSVSPLPDNYYAFFPQNSGTAQAQSQIVEITATQTPIRLAAKFASNAIEYGRTDELTGSLKYYQSAKTLKPLPDTTVTVSRLTPPGQPKITVKTNADGGFRVHIPRQTASGMWAATAGGTTLLGQAEVTRPLAVHQTTGFKRTSITLSAFGFLTVKSCLVDTSPGRSGTLVNSPVALQYGNRARARWKQLVTIEPTYGVPYCPGRSPLWTITVRAPAQNAYYRLRFPGNQTLRVSVSKVRHLWREETRITQFKVSPRHVHVNGAITVSGRLWRAATTKNSGDSARSGSWTPYAGRKVAIIFAYGGKEYAFDSEPKTNSQGDFSGLFTVYGTAEWLARYNGDKTHFSSSSRQIKVTASGNSGDALKLRELAGLIRAGVLAQAQAVPK